MTRRLVLAPEEARRVSRDIRYRSAKAAIRVPDPMWRARSACASGEPSTFFPDAEGRPDAARQVAEILRQVVRGRRRETGDGRQGRLAA